MKTVLITGNTFPVEDQLKALGSRWNPHAKGWEVPEAKATEALALVGPVPNQKSPEAGRAARRRGDICPECGDDCGGGYECGYA